MIESRPWGPGTAPVRWDPAARQGRPPARAFGGDSTPVSAAVCGSCGAPVLASRWLGLPLQLEPTPLTPVGHLVELAEGRVPWEIHPRTLEPVDRPRPLDAPEGAVLPVHRCRVRVDPRRVGPWPTPKALPSPLPFL